MVRDESDDKSMDEALAKPPVKVDAKTVPADEAGDGDKADVDVAVAVAADMALTGG